MLARNIKPAMSLPFILCCLATYARASADDWPQWRGVNRDGRWDERGLIERFSGDRITPLWKAEIGPGYSGPTVADGRVYLTDRQTEPEQAERVLCFAAGDGQLLWQHVYPCEYRGIGYEAGPRAAVTVDQGQAFALGAMGHLHCLDAEDGRVLWQRDLNHDYEIQRGERSESRMPMWGIAAAPLIYDGALMLSLREDRLEVDEVWRARGRSEKDTEALHSIISTPIWLGDHIYGVDSYGELRCLEAATGKRIWEDQSATPRARWSTIHFVQNGPRTWMFNERGELIIAKLSLDGFQEIGRAMLIEPTRLQLNQRGGVCWSHPAFANGHVFARNDDVLVCASLLASEN